MISRIKLKKLQTKIKADADIEDNDIRSSKGKPSYNFKQEFEVYEEVLTECLLEDENAKETILINHFDEAFGLKTMARFKKLGYRIRPATKKEVKKWRISDEEYTHKYSAFIIGW